MTSIISRLGAQLRSHFTTKTTMAKRLCARRYRFFKSYEINSFYSAVLKDLGGIKSRVSYFLHNGIYTTNHKRIAINYFIFIIFSGITGLVLATVIRLELAYPGVGILAGDSIQYLTIITLHGIIMVFFMIMPLFLGAFGNFLIPTQLGVHDVAFPRMNSASFGFLPGGLIMLCQLLCVDRRYQRVNCFNVREVQSLLKRKYFFDLIASHEAHSLHDKTLAGLRYKLSAQATSSPTFHLLNNHGIATGHRSRRGYFENGITPNFSINVATADVTLTGSTFKNYLLNFSSLGLKFAFIFDRIYSPKTSVSDGFIRSANLWRRTLGIAIEHRFTTIILPFLPRSYQHTSPLRIIYRMQKLLITDSINMYTTFKEKRYHHYAVKFQAYIERQREPTIVTPRTTYFRLFFDFSNILNISVLFDPLAGHTSFAQIGQCLRGIFSKIILFVDAIIMLNLTPVAAYLNVLYVQTQIVYATHVFGTLYSAINTLAYLVILDFLSIREQARSHRNVDNSIQSLLYAFVSSGKFNAISDTLRFSIGVESIRAIVSDSQNELGFRLLYRFDLLAIALFKTTVASVRTYQTPAETELYIYGQMLKSLQIDRPYLYFTIIASNAYSWMKPGGQNIFFIDPKFPAAVSQKLPSQSNEENSPKFIVVEPVSFAKLFQEFLFTLQMLLIYPFDRTREMLSNLRPTFVTRGLLFSQGTAHYGLHTFVNFRTYTANIFSNESLLLQTYLIRLHFLFSQCVSIAFTHFSEKRPLDIFTISQRMFGNSNGAQTFDRFLSSIEDLSLRFVRRSKPNFKYDDKAGNFLPEVRQHAFQQMIPSYSHISRGLARPVGYFSEDFYDRFSEFFSIYYENFVAKFAKEIAFAVQPLVAPEVRYYKLPFWHINGGDSLFAYSSSLLVDGELNNTRGTSLKSLTNKFNKMFMSEVQQYRLLNNGRSLKFHREAGRSRALLSRHQRSTYKRYLHEDALFWVVERNSRDVLPGGAFITPFASRTRFTATGKVDMALMAVFLAGAGSIISSANFLLTYRYLSTLGNKKMRDARSFFTEAAMISSGMIIGANPLLLIAILMLLSDRHGRTSFFDYSGGGDTVLFQHMFGFFGHPEVYIIIMPCFGITNTVLTYYLRKRISARASVLYSMYTIAFLSFFVGGHHMYMVGLSHQTRMLYSTVTVMISVPAATKIIHGMVTLVNSSIHFELPLLFTFTFIFFFISGGVSGMGVAHTGMDILFHDTFYVIAHFHVMFASAAMFSGFSAFYFYFPVLFGVKYSRIFAYMHYVYYLIGQLMTVIPMFWLGYAGMPRRILDYPTAFGGGHSIASAGHLISVAGLMAFFFMLVDSVRQSKAAIRTTFGVGRYNTRLNFYFYEIYRLNYLRTKSLTLLRSNSLPTITGKGQMYKNFEYLETSMYSYSLTKPSKATSKGKS